MSRAVYIQKPSPIMPKSLLAGWQRQDCCSSAARGPQAAGGFAEKQSSLMLHFALVYIFKAAAWGWRGGGGGKQCAAKVVFSWEIVGALGRGDALVGAAMGQSWVQLHPPCVGLGALFFLVSLVQMVSLGNAGK